MHLDPYGIYYHDMLYTATLLCTLVYHDMLYTATLLCTLVYHDMLYTATLLCTLVYYLIPALIVHAVLNFFFY